MNWKIKGFLLACALALCALPAVAHSFSTLEERMTGREFRDAGLHKLSDQELEFLNRWIQLRSLAEGEVPDWAEDRPVAPLPPPAEGATEPGERQAAADNRGLPGGDRSEINSRLIGSFSGWRGTAVFELENGMVWQQAEPGTFSVQTMENPEVRIRPGMFGAWHLQVGEYNTRVRVRRVE
ncbi:MAG: hypothetical protein EA419_01775 [Wenzhouxiangella sp.]|nr:MAG: hypothetical protein EA419_01775 [Wenzhouxiangella sp.]